MEFLDRINDVTLHDKRFGYLRSQKQDFLCKLVEEVCQATQAPFELVLASALGALASASQGCYDVRTPSGTLLPTSLNLLTIAESGERKTSVESLIFKPLRDYEAEQREKARVKRRAFEKELKLWKTKERQFLKEVVQNTSFEFMELYQNQGNKETVLELEESLGEMAASYKGLIRYMKQLADQEPTPPKEYRLLYEDTTPAALLDKLHLHMPVASLVSSEANSVIGSQAFRELHHLNSLWSGAPVTVDRVTKESFSLHDARLTLALMTQQVVVDRFLATKGEQARGMGFLARFLVVVPESTIGSRAFKVKDDLPILSYFQKRIRKLLEYSQDIWESSVDYQKKIAKISEEKDESVVETIYPPQEKRTELTFNKEAEKLWLDYSEAIEHASRPSGYFSFAKDHASKLLDNTARIAANLHLLEVHDGEIQAETLRRAFIICMNFSAHYMDVFSPRPRVVEDADKLCNFLIRRIHREHHSNVLPANMKQFICEHIDIQNYSCYISRKSLYNFGPTSLRNAKQFNETLDFLMQLGVIQVVVEIQDERLHVVEHDQTIRSAVFREAGSTYYKFSVLPQVVPRLRNGFGFTLDSLPLFSHLTPVFYLYKGSDGYAPNFMMTKPYNVNKLNAKIIEKQQAYQALMYEFGFTDEHPEDASRMGLIRPSDVFQVEESAKERVNYLKSLRKRYESSQANQLKRAPAKELRKEYDETLESLQLTSADLVEDFVSQLRGVTPSDHKKDYIY